MDWAAVSAIAAGCIVAGGVLRHILDFAFATGSQSNDLQSIQTLLLRQGAQLELLSSRFNDHVTEDARMFARLEAIVGETSKQQIAIESRISKAIEELTTELRGINSRVDRLLDPGLPRR